MHTNTRRRLAVPILGAALLLSACAQASGGAEPTGTADATEAAWPRTVEVGGTAVEIRTAPQRIVAMTTETGDVALELVGHERVVAVSDGSVAEGAGNQIEEARQVPTVLPGGTSPDPEQILALEPDLVLMTGRHEGEQAASDVLVGSGVPVLAFADDDFATIDAIAATVTTLGAALGAEQQAAGVVDAIRTEREQALARVAPDAAQPRVLLLMSRGGQVMVQPSSSLASHLVTEAGGTVVGAVERGVPADPESLIAAAPEVILVEDFRGAGLEPFRGILELPALADVPAVAEGRVHLVSGAIASGTAGTRAAEGLAEIVAVLHPDAA